MRDAHNPSSEERETGVWLGLPSGRLANLDTLSSRKQNKQDVGRGGTQWIKRLHVWGPERGSLKPTEEADRLRGNYNPWEAKPGDS